MTYTHALARTIYGEARGEYANTGPAAFMAVAWVVRNRLKHPKRFGGTVEQVCFKPYQFSCWNVKDPNRRVIENVTSDDALFALCHDIGAWVMQADEVADVTKGSDHYHARGITPYWTFGIHPQVTLGRHIFYCLTKEGL